MKMIDTTTEYWLEIQENISNTETNTLHEMLDTLEQFRNEWMVEHPFEDEIHSIRETRSIIRTELIERHDLDNFLEFGE